MIDEAYNNRVPYSQWALDGHLIATTGNVVYYKMARQLAESGLWGAGMMLYAAVGKDQAKLVFADAEKMVSASKRVCGELIDEEHEHVTPVMVRKISRGTSEAYDKTAMSQPERVMLAQKLAEAYIEYDDVQELAAHIECVLHLWELKGFELARGLRVVHPPRACEECTTSFVPKHGAQRFCAARCANRARARRYWQKSVK